MKEVFAVVVVEDTYDGLPVAVFESERLARIFVSKFPMQKLAYHRYAVHSDMVGDPYYVRLAKGGKVLVVRRGYPAENFAHAIKYPIIHRVNTDIAGYVFAEDKESAVAVVERWRLDNDQS